jgi:hypothetical protein
VKVPGKSARYAERTRTERRELFERLVGEGRVVIRYECPECSGPHSLAEHVEPKRWKAGDPRAAELAACYAAKARNGKRAA